MACTCVCVTTTQHSPPGRQPGSSAEHKVTGGMRLRARRGVGWGLQARVVAATQCLPMPAFAQVRLCCALQQAAHIRPQCGGRDGPRCCVSLSDYNRTLSSKSAKGPREPQRAVWVVGLACVCPPPPSKLDPVSSPPPHLWGVAPRHAARHLWRIRVSTTSSSSSAGHLRRQPSDLATHHIRAAWHGTAQHSMSQDPAGQDSNASR